MNLRAWRMNPGIPDGWRRLARLAAHIMDMIMEVYY